MNRITLPSSRLSSFNTAFNRSSNSPRNLAPAIRDPMSRARIFLSRRPSGTSPLIILWASPSTMAVLPTPGSPISTGLFLVRRCSTCTVLRISSSLPDYGIKFSFRCLCGQINSKFFQCLPRVFRIRIIHCLSTPYLIYDPFQCILPDAKFIQQ